MRTKTIPYFKTADGHSLEHDPKKCKPCKNLLKVLRGWRKQDRCRHVWKKDELVESGAVILLSGNVDSLESEMRYDCERCGAVKFELDGKRKINLLE